MSYDNPYRMCLKSCHVVLEVTALDGGWSSAGTMLEDIGITYDDVAPAYVPFGMGYDDPMAEFDMAELHKVDVPVLNIIGGHGTIDQCHALAMFEFPDIVFVADDQLS